MQRDKIEEFKKELPKLPPSRRKSTKDSNQTTEGKNRPISVVPEFNIHPTFLLRKVSTKCGAISQLEDLSDDGLNLMQIAVNKGLEEHVEALLAGNANIM